MFKSFTWSLVLPVTDSTARKNHVTSLN